MRLCTQSDFTAKHQPENDASTAVAVEAFCNMSLDFLWFFPIGRTFWLYKPKIKWYSIRDEI